MKKGPSLSLSGLGQALTKFLWRYHIMLYTMTVLVGVAVAVFLLSNVILAMDSLLSIVQMPAGVPVATVSINGAKNAGLLAVRILSAGDSQLVEKMSAYQERLRTEVEAKDEKLRKSLLGH